MGHSTSLPQVFEKRKGISRRGRGTREGDVRGI
jgi:hypothetical protein